MNPADLYPEDLPPADVDPAGGGPPCSPVPCPPRVYRRIGPHPSNVAGAVIVVETPRAGGGTHYAQARLTHTLPPATLDRAFAVLETGLEHTLREDT